MFVGMAPAVLTPDSIEAERKGIANKPATHVFQDEETGKKTYYLKVCVGCDCFEAYRLDKYSNWTRATAIDALPSGARAIA